MPNYTLTPFTVQGLRDGIKRYLDDYIAEAEREFPLQLAELQRAIVPPATLELIDNLVNEHNFTTLTKFDNVYFRLPEREDIPRPPQIRYWTAQSRIYLRDAQHTIGSGEHNEGVRRITNLTLDLTQIDEPTIHRLVEWCNRAVTARRAVNLALDKIKTYTRLNPSLWHILVQWPALKLGFDKNLKSRAADMPRYPRRYGWDSDSNHRMWYEENQKFMPLIDHILMETSLLVRAPPVTPRAWVWNWQKKEGDKF